MADAEIIIPASTSNLGASFDACGLALALYLRVAVEACDGGFQIIPSGEGAESLPRDESNLVARVARFVADDRGRKIGGARLLVDNQIPLARGLGSSSAAIVAGVSVYEALSGERLSEEEIFGYALGFEDHGDNLAPSLLGGLVVTCLVARGARRSLATIKRAWPDDVKIVLAIPEFEMDTSEMRRALPTEVRMSDAVFNLQRSALLQAILSERRFDLLSEALRDRLHQPYRATYGPGLGAVLRLNDETREHPGLLGVAISGAGSTAIAFAEGNFSAIASAMSERFAACGARAKTLEVGVDNGGRSVRVAGGR
jgi:homoserine kinase